MFYSIKTLALCFCTWLKHLVCKTVRKTRQKLTQLSPRSRPRYPVGKTTTQKDTIIDITSDSQVNSMRNFPYRWSLVNLTFNVYFYLFLYLYITRITVNNNMSHLKSLKNQTRRATLGRPAIKLLGEGLKLICGRPTFALDSALVHLKTTTNNKNKTNKTQTKPKLAAGTEGQVVTMRHIQNKQTQ